MSGRAGDELELARLGGCGKPSENLSLPAVPHRGLVAQPFPVRSDRPATRWLEVGPDFLLFGEFRHPTEVASEPFLQQGVPQHRPEGGGHAECEAPRDAIEGPSVEDPKQGQVAFENGLEKPRLLVELGMFRVSDKGQVRVEEQRKMDRVPQLGGRLHGFNAPTPPRGGAETDRSGAPQRPRVPKCFG